MPRKSPSPQRDPTWRKGRAVSRAGLPLLLLVLVACVRPQASAHLRRLARCLEGSFDSAEQAQSDPAHFSDIRLEVVRIWPTREDGLWFYLEQAEATSLARPYRQRLLRLTALPDGRFLSLAYALREPQRFTGAWRDPSHFPDLPPSELAAREGCGVVLTAQNGGTFQGSTQGRGCESHLHGAAYATSEVALSPTLMVSWDRGFDAQGHQVWGATAGPYRFRKRSPAAR